MEWLVHTLSSRLRESLYEVVHIFHVWCYALGGLIPVLLLGRGGHFADVERRVHEAFDVPLAVLRLKYW